jgi:hypothetical protein
MAVRAGTHCDGMRYPVAYADGPVQALGGSGGGLLNRWAADGGKD